MLCFGVWASVAEKLKADSIRLTVFGKVLAIALTSLIVAGNGIYNDNFIIFGNLSKLFEPVKSTFRKTMTLDNG